MITVRPYREDDHNYIVSTWLQSAARSAFYGPGTAAWARSVLDRSTFYDLARPVVATVLDHGATLVAVDPEDESSILGWVACFGGRVVWGYVGKAFRGHGVWRHLSKEALARGLAKELPKPPKHKRQTSSEP